MTWREALALKIEGCLADMERSNERLRETLNYAQEHLFKEDKMLSKEKALARVRAKFPEEQRRLEQVAPAKVSKAKGKRGSVQHLGEAKDIEQMREEAEQEDELATVQDLDRIASSSHKKGKKAIELDDELRRAEAIEKGRDY